MKRLKIIRRFSRRTLVLACVMIIAMGVTFTAVTLYRHTQQITRAEIEARTQIQAKKEADKLKRAEELKRIAISKQAGGDAASFNITDSSKRAARPSATSKPGDLIANNATKKAKTYYGGPLIFTPSTVTISSSSPRPKVTVTSYDGAAISMPTFYWDTNPQVSVGVDKNVGVDIYAEHSSWPMVVDAVTGLGPGTYSAEIVAHTHNDIDTVEYSGYLTVIVAP